jgi:hypothetical protein
MSRLDKPQERYRQEPVLAEPSPKKSRMISMRVTEEQYQYLEEMAQRIRKTTGFRVTRASIVLKLMEYGLPYLEKEFPAPKKKWWSSSPSEDDEEV